MKKGQKKLTLSKETVRSLEQPELRNAEGANADATLQSVFVCSTSKGIFQCEC